VTNAVSMRRDITNTSLLHEMRLLPILPKLGET
jgi:hypothetical protein